MPREIRYCRPKTLPQESLLSHLVSKFTYLDHDAWTQHIAAGHVFVNGAVTNNGTYVLQQGDMLRFAPPRSLEPRVDDEHIAVLYEDDAVVVCVKNGNLPVAEGGRYCENTLISVLQREGTAKFYTIEAAARCCSAVNAGHEYSAGAEETHNLSSEVDKKAVTKTTKFDAAVESPPRKRVREARHSRFEQRDATQTPVTASAFFTVQRLDKETSGVLVLCKSSAAAKHVAGQLEGQTRRCSAAVEAHVARSPGAITTAVFDKILQESEKTVRKAYTAVLCGAAPVGETFVIVNMMSSIESHPTLAQETSHSQLKKLKMCCEPLPSPCVPLSSSSATLLNEGKVFTRETSNAPQPTTWGKVACTRVRVLASSTALNVSCVQVELLTGRSHQIRVHCATVGYPVLGDKLYTSITPTEARGCVAVPDEVYLTRVRNEDDPYLLVDNGADEGHRMWCSRHLLHATELQLAHPTRTSETSMTFVASPVESFLRDVRFDAKEDADTFRDLLLSAFAQYSNGSCIAP